MKRTNYLTKIVSVLLFVAMASYLGVYMIKSLTNDIRTAPAVYLSIEESIQMSGVIVRDEEYFESNEQYLSIRAENGKMLAAGDIIAVSFSSEEALKRAGRIHELQLQQQYIISVLQGNKSDTVEKKDGNIKSAITKLAAAAARHETEQLSSAVLDLTALVLDQSGVNATQADLTTVQEELLSLKQTAARDTKSITASESGLFCISEDGYEHLNFSDLKGISPSKLESLTKSPEDIPEQVIGKMVYSSHWYYAAYVSQEDAARLKEGESRNLDFGRFASEPVKGKILSISAPEDKKCVVVFRCTTAMADMLSVRFADANTIYDTCEGLRVPKNAAYVDEDGTYVYVVEGVRAAKKYIEIFRDMDDYYLVEISNEDDALKANSNIIISSRELSDGMLLQ